MIRSFSYEILVDISRFCRVSSSEVILDARKEDGCVSSTQSPDVVECMSDFRCKPFWVFRRRLNFNFGNKGNNGFVNNLLKSRPEDDLDCPDSIVPNSHTLLQLSHGGTNKVLSFRINGSAIRNIWGSSFSLFTV